MDEDYGKKIAYIRAQLENHMNGYSPSIAEMFNQLIDTAYLKGAHEVEEKERLQALLQPESLETARAKAVENERARLEAQAIATMEIPLSLGSPIFVRGEVAPGEVRAWMCNHTYVIVDMEVLHGMEDEAPLVPTGTDDLI